ncbi:hypothetical protein N478_14195 [Pseudoalteromonas luteoviolacea S4060-1]|uniref:Uncharacterized protein n=2 Tax=Pseudoalteromonas luteoviolacea TaxID=43657 RepID=A0A162B9W0_9GAMM|nr:hypothetical protein N478_14195 [Pseudoalteromonas luteoviolacea S4060-1]
MCLIAIYCSPALSATCEETNVKITSIRAVSEQFPQAPHKNTVELHHEMRDYCSLDACSTANRYRVAIDGADNHIISAAYMAFASGKPVNIFVDTNLGTRSGICVVSYLTIAQ